MIAYDMTDVVAGSHTRDISSPEEQDDHPFHSARFGTTSGQVSSSEQDDSGQVSS